MEHELKILPEFFKAIQLSLKRAEVRKNDRNYIVGDILILKEYSNNKFTGREIKRLISHIVKGGQFGLDKDYVMLSFIMFE